MSYRSDALYACLYTDVQRNAMDNYKPAQLLLSDVFSKFADDHTSAPDVKALEKFLASNERCRTHDFSEPGLFFGQLIRDIKFSLLDLKSPEIEELYPEPGCFSPGSSYGSVNGNFLRKLGSKPACTSRYLWGLFVQSTRNTNLCGIFSHGVQYVAGNKLSFVPKNNESSRVIASEPIVNMYFQKKTENYLTRFLTTRGIHLKMQQTVNRKLARQGSVDGTLCTIDLSSASDSVSIELCRLLLPPDFFEWLMVIRSPCTKIPDGTLISNHMISSMGNATTFPLQTLIFLEICRAVSGIVDPKATISVFGDDIIVSKTIFNAVISALAFFGFRPNEKKTFSEGNFRESCGGDYIDGRNVRPVYIRSLKGKTDIYSAINRLVIWSARHHCPLDDSISFLRKLVRFNAVPICEDVCGGIRCLTKPRRGPTNYRVFVPQLRQDDLKHQDWVLLLGFLRGDIRDGKCSIRSFNSLSTVRYRKSYDWLYIDRSSTLLEDLADEWYLYYIHYYGLVTGM